jgi:Na+/H+ antiporter NhaD/arsenite permease-like protein
VAEAADLVNWDTIALLLGMMMIIAGVQMDGAAATLAEAVLGRARTGMGLAIVVVVFTGAASAFLVNDAVVLAVTPLLVTHCRAKGLNPVPYLLAEAMASNIGGVATITGNPQNVLVGTVSGIGFGRFMAHLLPVAALSSLVLLGVLRWRYPAEMTRDVAHDASPRLGVRQVLTPAVAVLALTVLGFLLSPVLPLEIPEVALLGGGLVLLTGRRSPTAMFAQVDWVLLLFFAALFVVIGAAVQEGLFDWTQDSSHLENDIAGAGVLHGLALVVSQLISNVPFTVLLAPIVEPTAGDLLWLSLASGATLAGNLTLLGSVANLIVAEGAERKGVRIEFGEYLKAGAAVTLLSMAGSMLVLWAERAAGWL